MLEHSTPDHQPSGSAAVCTLFETNCHCGRGTMVDSLLRAGYEGNATSRFILGA
jgi:hypothetical protein